MDARRFGGRQRSALYLAQDGRCASCGAELVAGWHADHKQAWSRGGATDVVNGQALCPACNLRKGSKGQVVNPLRKWQREAIAVFLGNVGENFTLEATPAAGKTRFMGEVARRLLDEREVDAVLIVVPTTPLRKQIARSLSADVDIQVDPKWEGNCQLVRKEYRGAVVTYQWLAQNMGQVRKVLAERATFVILDEIHHAAHERSWGTALRDALGPAHRRLLTTGTPFRTDGMAIPFMRIKEDDEGKLRSDPDYAIRYGTALQQGIVRAVFFNRRGGLMEWLDETGHQLADFDKDLDDQDQSRRLRTALMVGGEHLSSMLREANAKLEELRLADPDAGGIVLAMDQAHANAIAKWMQRELGVDPVVPLSADEGDQAENKIAAFRESSQRWIVAVRMVSEGVDIPRLRVCVFATNVVTALYFRQAVGRVVRVEPKHKDNTAYFYIPDDPRLREFARDIAEEVDMAIREPAESDRESSETEPPEEGPIFVPISAGFNAMGTFIGDVHLTPDELAHAEQVRLKTPMAAGFTREAIAALLRTHMQMPGDFAEQSGDDVKPEGRPLFERLNRLRQRNNQLATAIWKRYNVEFDAIHLALNKLVGIASVTTSDDEERLKLRITYAEYWLQHGKLTEAS